MLIRGYTLKQEYRLFAKIGCNVTRCWYRYMSRLSTTRNVVAIAAAVQTAIIVREIKKLPLIGTLALTVKKVINSKALLSVNAAIPSKLVTSPPL